jgi:hypothetical protein
LARVECSTRRQEANANGPPSTSPVIATAISVDCRILHRTTERYAGYEAFLQRIEAKPDPPDGGDPTATDLAA